MVPMMERRRRGATNTWGEGGCCADQHSTSRLHTPRIKLNPITVHNRPWSVVHFLRVCPHYVACRAAEGSRHRGDVGVAPDGTVDCDDDVEELSLPGTSAKPRKTAPPLTKFSKSAALRREKWGGWRGLAMDSQQSIAASMASGPLHVYSSSSCRTTIAVLLHCRTRCESHHALNAIDHDASNDGERMEPWTAIDALYFTTVDVHRRLRRPHPIYTGSRIFDGVDPSISFVFIQFAIVFQHLFGLIGNVINRLVQIIYAAGPANRKPSSETYLWFMRELLLYLFIFCLQLIVGIIILWTEPTSSSSTRWYCFVTATTVATATSTSRPSRSPLRHVPPRPLGRMARGHPRACRS